MKNIPILTYLLILNFGVLLCMGLYLFDGVLAGRLPYDMFGTWLFSIPIGLIGLFFSISDLKR